MEMDINSTLGFLDYSCILPETRIIFLSAMLLFFLLIPLLIFILVVGFKRWRKKTVSSPFTTSNHSDILTYNTVFLDLLGIAGVYFMFFGGNTNNADLWMSGSVIYTMYPSGHILFQLLTCMERYLAVVHPLFYLRLRGSLGGRIRNMSIGCVWLISIGVMIIILRVKLSLQAISFSLVAFTFVVFCFCSLSVLYVLMLPGPGEQGDKNKLSNQSKKRAVRPMVIITGALLLRFISILIAFIVQAMSDPFGYVFCVAGLSSYFSAVPNSLVLPLLFLQRAGKLHFCGNRSDAKA